MRLYPVHLLLEGKTALVVGGGAVASAKAAALVEAGARVRVVAPALSPEMTALASRHALEIRRGEFAAGDLEAVQLVVAATNQPEIQERVFTLARQRGVLVGCVDDVGRSDFISPAVLRRGDLVLTVSTSGTAPALAARLRDHLGELFGPEWEPLLVRLRAVRARMSRRWPDLSRRKRAWYRIVDSVILPAMRGTRAIPPPGRRGREAE